MNAEHFGIICGTQTAPLQKTLINAHVLFAPENKDHFVDLVLSRQEISRSIQGDLRRFSNWVAIRAATDRGKRDRPDPVFNRQLQRIPITIRQCLRFAAFPAAPHRSDRVNHKPGRQTIPAGNFRFARMATAKCSALRKQFGSGCAMNRAVDSASAEQRGVGRVHNRVDVELGNVTTYYADPSPGSFHFKARLG